MEQASLNYVLSFFSANSNKQLDCYLQRAISSTAPLTPPSKSHRTSGIRSPCCVEAMRKRTKTCNLAEEMVRGIWQTIEPNVILRFWVWATKRITDSFKIHRKLREKRGWVWGKPVMRWVQIWHSQSLNLGVRKKLTNKIINRKLW